MFYFAGDFMESTRARMSAPEGQRRMRLRRAGKRTGRSIAAGVAPGVAGLALAASAITAEAGRAASSVKPVNSSPPTISGTPQEGKSLTANRGTWDNNPTDYDYVWRRCATDGSSCANISSATGLTYT
jgi:hypothetical protein